MAYKLILRRLFILTLKAGYDVAGVGDIMVTKFYTLKFETKVGDIYPPLIENGRILTGNPGKFSLYSGPLAFFEIGDLLKEEEGLRGQATLGAHEGWLWVVVPGESKDSKDKMNEIARIVRNYIKYNPEFGNGEGLKVYIRKDDAGNPMQRMRVSFNDKTTAPDDKKWNNAILLKLMVFIPDIPKTVS